MNCTSDLRLRALLLALFFSSALNAEGVPVATPRVDQMNAYAGRVALAQLGPGRTVAVWTAAEEQGYAVFASEAVLSQSHVQDVPLRIAETCDWTMQALVTPTATGYLVAWLDVDGIHADAVEPPNGMHRGKAPIVAGARPLAMATSSDAILLVYDIRNPGSWTLGCAFLTASGEILRSEDLGTFRGEPRVGLAPVDEGFLMLYAENYANANPLITRKIESGHIGDAHQIDVSGPSGPIAIASSPGGALAVWSLTAGEGPLVARHLDHSGATVDERFPLSISAMDASVAWDGSRYLVAYAGHYIRGIYVSATAPRAEEQIVIAGTVNEETEPVVVSDGTTSSVAWKSARWSAPPVSSSIKGAAVNRSGTTTAPVLISRSVTDQDLPSAASANGITVAAWMERTGETESVFFGRVDSEGNALDGTGTSVGNGTLQSSPQVASDGDSFLLAWVEDRGYLDARVFGQRIAGDGNLVGERFEITGVPERQITQMRLASSSDTYMAVWVDTIGGAKRGLSAATILSTGVVRDRFVVEYSNDQVPLMNLAIAGGPRGFLVTSDTFYSCNIECPPHTPDVFATAFDSRGAPFGPPQTIARNAGRASAASSGDRYLVVYAGEHGTEGEYLAASGSIVSEAFTIHPRAATSVPSVVYDGTGFIVAADVGGLTHFPILAIVRGGSTESTSMLAEASVHGAPKPLLVGTPDRFRSMYREFVPEFSAMRLLTRGMPFARTTDVAVAVTTDYATIIPGRETRVEVRVANAGAEPASGVGVLVDFTEIGIAKAPAGCLSVPYNNSVVCNLGGMSPGSVITLPFDIVLSSGWPSVNATIEANAYAVEQDGFLDNNFSRIKLELPARRRATRR